MSTVRPGVMSISAQDNSRPGKIIKLDIQISDKDIKTRLKESVKSAKKVINLEEADIIVSGGRGLKDKENLFKVNVEGTKNVLQCSYDNKVKNFIHISSVAALGYKDSKTEFVDETYKFDWDLARRRKKYYMLTKHLADLEVKKYKDKMRATILYPGLMFGPGDLKNSAKLIQAIKDNKIPYNMPGGTNIIDVRDVAQGIVAALTYHVDIAKTIHCKIT